MKKNSILYSNIQDRRIKQQPKYKLGQLSRTADIKWVFSKGTNWSDKLYTISDVIHDTIPSYRLNYLPEKYNENLLLPTKLSPNENIGVTNKLIEKKT